MISWLRTVMSPPRCSSQVITGYDFHAGRKRSYGLQEDATLRFARETEPKIDILQHD